MAWRSILLDSDPETWDHRVTSGQGLWNTEMEHLGGGMVKRSVSLDGKIFWGWSGRCEGTASLSRALGDKQSMLVLILEVMVRLMSSGMTWLRLNGGWAGVGRGLRQADIPYPAQHYDHSPAARGGGSASGWGQCPRR